MTVLVVVVGVVEVVVGVVVVVVVGAIVVVVVVVTITATGLVTPVTMTPASCSDGEFTTSSLILSAKDPESIESTMPFTSLSSVVDTLATITVVSLLLRDEVLSSNSIDEFETPRTFATELIKSSFRSSKFEAVTPSNVISVVIFVIGGALVVVLVVIFVVPSTVGAYCQ